MQLKDLLPKILNLTLDYPALAGFHSDLKRIESNTDLVKKCIRSWFETFYHRQKNQSLELKELASDLFTFINTDYYRLQTSSGSELSILPKNWKKAINSPGMQDLIKAYEQALIEKQNITEPTAYQLEAIAFLDQAFNLDYIAASELFKTRQIRLTALMIKPVSIGLPALNHFWTCFTKIYGTNYDAVVILMDLGNNPQMNVLNDPIQSQVPLHNLHHDILLALEKELEITNRNATLSNREGTDNNLGYTANPYSKTNLRFAQMAWNLAKNQPNPREAFWKLLYPNIKKTWMGETDQDWPNYGEAIYTEHGLINYVKLARMCQFKDVYSTVFGQDKLADPMIKTIMLAHPNYWEFTPQLCEIIKRFNPDDRAFWLNHDTDQNDFGPRVRVKNYADFFREMHKVLNRFKATELNYSERGSEMDEAGLMAIRPFQEFLWTSRLIPDLEARLKTLDIRSEEYVTISRLIGLRTNLAPSQVTANSRRIESCFNINAKSLSSIFHGNEKKSNLILWLESEACEIKPKPYIRWVRGTGLNTDKRPISPLVENAVTKVLNQVNEPKLVFDWLEYCQKIGFSVPFAAVNEKVLQYIQNKSVSEVYNFIYSHSPNNDGLGGGELFYDSNGQDLKYDSFMTLFTKKLFKDGIPNTSLLTSKDFKFALELHLNHGIPGLEQTRNLCSTFLKANGSYIGLNSGLIPIILSDPILRDSIRSTNLFKSYSVSAAISHIKIIPLIHPSERENALPILLSVHNLISLDWFLIKEFHDRYPDDISSLMSLFEHLLSSIKTAGEQRKAQILNTLNKLPEKVKLKLIVMLFADHVFNDAKKCLYYIKDRRSPIDYYYQFYDLYKEGIMHETSKASRMFNRGYALLKSFYSLENINYFFEDKTSDLQYVHDASNHFKSFFNEINPEPLTTIQSWCNILKHFDRLLCYHVAKILGFDTFVRNYQDKHEIIAVMVEILTDQQVLILKELIPKLTAEPVFIRRLMDGQIGLDYGPYIDRIIKMALLVDLNTIDFGITTPEFRRLLSIVLETVEFRYYHFGESLSSKVKRLCFTKDSNDKMVVLAHYFIQFPSENLINFLVEDLNSFEEEKLITKQDRQVFYKTLRSLYPWVFLDENTHSKRSFFENIKAIELQIDILKSYPEYFDQIEYLIFVEKNLAALKNLNFTDLLLAQYLAIAKKNGYRPYPYPTLDDSTKLHLHNLPYASLDDSPYLPFISRIANHCSPSYAIQYLDALLAFDEQHGFTAGIYLQYFEVLSLFKKLPPDKKTLYYRRIQSITIFSEGIRAMIERKFNHSPQNNHYDFFENCCKIYPIFKAIFVLLCEIHHLNLPVQIHEVNHLENTPIGWKSFLLSLSNSDHRFMQQALELSLIEDEDQRCRAVCQACLSDTRPALTGQLYFSRPKQGITSALYERVKEACSDFIQTIKYQNRS